MAIKIQLRRDTAANWTAANPVLAVGEAGFETNTKKLKLGDGTTAWNSLAYYNPTHDLGTHGADTLANLNAVISDATLIDTGDSRLSDARTPTTHAFAGAEHSASTLAEVNGKVSDATLIDTGDSRLSDSRTCDNTFDSAATSRTNLDVYSTSEVDGKVTGLYDHKGAYDANANSPDLDTSPSGVLKGDAYTVSVAGTFFTEAVEIGDVLIADQDSPTLLTHWTRVQKNLEFGTTAGTICEGNDSRLSDSRTPTSHAFAGAEHSASTLASVNSKISDATLIDTGDSRLSDDRTASGLKTATTTVSISGATAPTTGQVLKATSGTNATWQNESGGGSAITVEDEGTPLTTAVTKFNFAGAGVVVTEPATDEMLVTIAGGGGGASSQPSLVTRKSTTTALSTTPVKILWDAPDVETSVSDLERNDTTTSRIDCKTAGEYLVSYSGVWAPDTTQKKVIARIKKNNVEVAHSLFDSGDFDIGVEVSKAEITKTIVVTCAASDYLEFELEMSADIATLQAGVTITVVKLSGTQGATGATGADGDMTWEGTWVSQNYTANQAVKYTDGNSYVCHTNTVSSEVPTNTSYWDILAEKGDTGSSGVYDNCPIFTHSDNKKSDAGATYATQAHYAFRGTGVFTPLTISAIAWVDAGTGGAVRIYDVTNSLVIAELTGISGTTKAILDLGTISNLSAGNAVWEIQIKGDASNLCNIAGIVVEG